MNTDNLISRSTHTTGRSILTVGSVVILSKWFDYPLDKFPVISLAENPPIGLVTTAALWLMVFLLVTHVLNWWNDWIGYRASAYRTSMPSGFNIHGYWGAIKAIHQGKAQQVEATRSEFDKDIESLHKHLDKTLRDFSVAQWVQIFVQHLATPVLVAVVAIVRLV